MSTPTLQDLRKAKFKTIKAFAAACGFSASTGSIVLQGRHLSTISNDELAVIANALGISCDECYEAMVASYQEWREKHPPVTPTPEQIAEHEASIKAYVDKVWPTMSDAAKRRVHEQAVKMGLVQERRSPIDILIDRAVGRE